MSGKSLQPPAHVNQIFDLRIAVIGLSKLWCFQGLVKRHAQIPRNHLGHSVALGVGHIQNPSHVPDHALGRQGTEGYNLHDPIPSILLHHIVDNLLTAFKAEININIRHGYSFRIQKPLEQQVIADGVNIRNSQAVGDDASRRRASSRPYHDVVGAGEVDKIPHNQEVIHIAHGLYDGKLIVQTLSQASVVLWIPLLKP